MPINLHFVCRQQQNWKKLDQNLFETRDWSVSKKTAAEAVGGRIHLHEKRSEPAWHGGTVKSWRSSGKPGCQIFCYEVDGPFRVRLNNGWGQEKAIVKL